VKIILCNGQIGRQSHAIIPFPGFPEDADVHEFPTYTN